jgi:hypothetical protein
MKIKTLAAAFSVTFMAMATTALADGAHVAPVTEYVNSQVKSWINDPIIINAVKAQDAKNAGLAQADIDALDKKWRAEVESADKPMIDGVLENEASKFLQQKQAASDGVITEIFVMDDKGLNVAQSDATSDYWQGDEAKFQKSFGVGPDALFVDDAEKDESTQKFQAQASFTLKDETGKPIGAVTVGVSLDNL